MAAAAAGPGDVDCLRALMDAGADPVTKDANGFTALDHAVRFGSSEAIKLLYERQRKQQVRGR